MSTIHELPHAAAFARVAMARTSDAQLALGNGQEIFAGHFYRKADAYLHSGMCPAMFDENDSFNTAQLAKDAEAASSLMRAL